MLRHLERKCCRLRKNLDVRVNNLDLARGQCVVRVAFRTWLHRSSDLDDRFVFQFIGNVFVNHDLNNARRVTQINKRHTTVVAATIDPTSHSHRLIDVVSTQASSFVST